MKPVLIIGSGHSAVEANDLDLSLFTVVVVNNAILAVETFDYWVRATDYKGKTPKYPIESTKIITNQYMDAVKKHGGIKACGYSIMLAASYWVLENLSPNTIYYLGADMNYKPDTEGKTHFYGVGYDIRMTGKSDPDKMVEKYSNGDSKYLEKLYMRFHDIAKEKGCEVYNLSSVTDSRLPYKRMNKNELSECNRTA